MRLSRAQAAVITLLNILIIGLAAVILFVPKNVWAGFGDEEPSTATGGDIVDEPKPEHEKYRAATSGKVEGISRETRLMGLGDETVIKAFELNGKTYIFGNAPVSGLDFDTYGGYACVLGADGAITSYAYFDGNINCACMFGTAFVVSAGKALYIVDASGAAVKKAELGATAIDVIPIDNVTIAAVTQPTQQSILYTEYAVAGETWSVGRATRIDSGYTLRYFGCYGTSTGCVIAARAHSLPRYDALVLFDFKPGSDATAHYYGGESTNITRPYAVMPYTGGGYIAAVSIGGVATIMTVDYEFTEMRVQSLGFTFYDARMFYECGKYYMCFDRIDGSVTYTVGTGLDRTRLDALDGVSIQATTKNNGEPIFIGVPSEGGGNTAISGNSTSLVTVHGESGKVTDYAVSRATVEYAACAESGELTVILSAAGGDALTPTSGGRDVYAIIMRQP